MWIKTKTRFIDTLLVKRLINTFRQSGTAQQGAVELFCMQGANQHSRLMIGLLVVTKYRGATENAAIKTLLASL